MSAGTSPRPNARYSWMMDVLVIGAGPAGMSAALELQERGLEVTVVDDQPAPGGRIFAAIETRTVYGAEDRRGKELVGRFRKMGGTYLPGTDVWQIEAGPRVYFTCEGRASMVEPRFVLMATGAQERPMPFPGWQLPGVMTVGAAQIMLKTARQIPNEAVWLAGSGPLLLLYAHQLMRAGGTIAGILDTTPSGRLATVTSLLPGALGYGWRDLLRGAVWLAKLRKERVRIVRAISSISAVGEERLTGVRYATRTGEEGEVRTSLLLIHDGVAPALHGVLAAGGDYRWNPVQYCFEPVVDRFGSTSLPGIYVAGDGAAIAGARAAMLSGRLAAIGILLAAGQLSIPAADVAAAPLRRKLAAAARFRHFLDHVYPPSNLPIPDPTLICRCEEVSAEAIRASLKSRTHLGPDGAKIATRAGMGPCQGRQCGLSMVRLVTEIHDLSPDLIGFPRIRPPLKPLTLGELAALEETR